MKALVGGSGLLSMLRIKSWETRGILFSALLTACASLVRLPKVTEMFLQNVI